MQQKEGEGGKKSREMDSEVLKCDFFWISKSDDS